MNYLLKSKPKNEHGPKIILIVSLYAVLTVIGFCMPNILRHASVSLAKPLWFVGDMVARPFSGVHNFFTFRSTLISQNKILEDKVASLELKQIDYDALAKENQTLQEELGRGMRSRVVAGILSKPPRSPYDTFIIDAGTLEEVKVGANAYIGENILIGTVESVTPHTSIIRLFSSSGVQQEAVLSRTGTSYVLSGTGGANFILEVPKDTDIMWGDTFSYPGILHSVLGSVYYIDINSQSSFKKVYIRIPGNVFSSREVFLESMI